MPSGWRRLPPSLAALRSSFLVPSGPFRGTPRSDGCSPWWCSPAWARSLAPSSRARSSGSPSRSQRAFSARPGLREWPSPSCSQRSRCGRRACSGVPALRLKLLACAVSGGLLAAAGAPYPYYASFVEPSTAFSLVVGGNAIAMPLIGGTRSWVGPVLGAVLLGSIQQVTTVTISSELNILLVGLVLIALVAIAPGGLLALFPRLHPRAVA